jgi:adenylate cyclase class IV
MFPISGYEFSHVFFSHVAGEFQARQEALRRRVVDGSDELRVLKDSMTSSLGLAG